ncbi:MAG: ATP-binding protein [Anaerolineae bacterium]|nr:ATP-binding protein [Anaerolineae bacterium]
MVDDNKSPSVGPPPSVTPPTVPPSSSDPAADGVPSGVRSLRDLIDQVTGRDFSALESEGETGLAETWPFPFLAMVGQAEMKLGLLLTLINPAIGGILLVGPRGTGKTTAVRSLIDLLPAVSHSKCHYGCMEEEIESGGIDAVCPDCAIKYGQGQPLSTLEPVRLVELPLNARLEDVVGSLDERAALHKRMLVRRGIMAQADRNLLYVDEVNLLNDQVVDAILDAAAQGRYTVRRGAVAATYYSRFSLVGTMNPEEGNLRPQILDRFGLRLLVRGLENPKDRLEAYQRSQAYLTNPRRMVDLYAEETLLARDEIQAARSLLPQVTLPDRVANAGLKMIKSLNIASLRAELTLFEAARAYAAASGRTKVKMDDLRQVAAMSLRLRRSPFITQYFVDQEGEEQEIIKNLEEITAPTRSKSIPKNKKKGSGK